MGTFDSVYLNKIRHLEEENQQLRNILNEYYAPSFPLEKRIRIGGRAVGELAGALAGKEINKIDLSKIDKNAQPIDGRGASPRGISGLRDRKLGGRKPDFSKNDLSKVGSGYFKEYILGQQPKKKPDVPVPPTPDSGGPGLPSARPPARPQGRSEPAPYASDDMESRRVQPGYGGADGPEGMKDQFGRSRDHHNYGRPPLMPQGGFGRPLYRGKDGIYRPIPPKGDLSYW